MGTRRRLWRRLLGIEALDRRLRRLYTGHVLREPYPRGHFHSPLPDPDVVRAQAADLFRTDVDLGPSLDLRERQQVALFEALAEYGAEFPARPGAAPAGRFTLEQSFFCAGDALILYGMLRHLRPARVIEVGSGHSSALMLDTDERFLDGRTRFTFIEPYPARLHGVLRDADRARHRVLEVPVQDVPLTVFDDLAAGDLLFIDSSHVARIGSDVNHLLFEVLPRLAPGVVVHVHDILWPFEYPESWVAEGRAWNEAYLVRAFLQYNARFEILLFNAWIGQRHRELARRRLPLFLENPGGSLWLQCRRDAAAG